MAVALGQELPFSESLAPVLNKQEVLGTAINRLDAFVNHLDKKQQPIKKKRNFINYLYDETHREFLSSYEQLSSFEDLVSSGKYNCLTGSTFFAFLLDRYQIEFKVIETNYHMFILITDEDREYILDVTDRINGFETNAVLVENRLTEYKSGNQERKNNTVTFQFDLFNQVSLTQLGGLLAFNHSVEAYNRQDLASAVNYLYDASLFYRSPRIMEMAKLIEGQLQSSPATSANREKIAKILQLESVLIASN
jgi:hypothetical protein